eukprot:GHVT01072584.1.p1 GENE.GHVT01072584.1~~GHVT01072584.1.p1  ORF type:complete len:305 (-),score=65.41 GHVT01072584.1:1403-2317(-)
MLWIDKHCPRHLNELSCHPKLTQLLQQLAAKGEDLPHVLFYGPSGAGKKTRAMALLRALFGDSVDQVKAESFNLKEHNAEFVLCQSRHHMQLSCPELGTKDRVVVQYVIKDLSSSSPGAAFLQGTGPAYRVFLFQDAETMSEGAQAGLRRTLERFVRNARVILLVDQLSCIISPVRSRCLCIRVPLPTPTEVLSVLRDTCTKENLSPAVVPDAFLQRLVERSECNVRRALVLLEGAADEGISRFKSFDLPWELQVDAVLAKFLKVQHPRVITECRDMLYDLLACGIPADLILQAGKLGRRPPHR